MNERPMRIDWQARTDRGTVRDNNEDNYAAHPETGIWAVADGMGGHERGDWASERIVAAIETVRPNGDFDQLVKDFSSAIHTANAEIYEASVSHGARMGSTVVGLVIGGRRFAVVWAGDSRAYLLRRGTFIQLTTDHTQVQALIDRGILAPEEARSHPMSHVLAKAVGVESSLELDAIADIVEPGDIFLLCSDGLYGTLNEGEIHGILAVGPPSTAAETLLDRCLVSGAGDNVTIVIIQAQEPTSLIFAPGNTLIDGGGQ